MIYIKMKFISCILLYVKIDLCFLNGNNLGISCISKFSELATLFRTGPEMLIIQKYIERPLLIYNTKFDIRQWFLVTSWSPLTIWWYNDSYIRFCSQQFTLNDFNEAVHLSNNSIQNKYENGTRSQHLPACNMWYWQDFENYLNENGFENAWQRKILPSMKNTIIDILLCSQEDIEDRKNSFELYGADFMITEGDLRTWLIEINSSPCLAPSTEVTAKLTKSVLEDILKVVLDYPHNLYCDTGEFQLLYKQSPFAKSVLEQSYDLAVVGYGIKKPFTYSYRQSKDTGKLIPRGPQDDNSLLKNKLRNVVENGGGSFKRYKFDEPVKKHYYRTYSKLIQDIKTADVFSPPIDVKYGRTQSVIQGSVINKSEIIKSNCILEEPYFSSYVGPRVSSNEEKFSNLPDIKTSLSKPTDKSPNKNKSFTEKNNKTGYFYDNFRAAKFNFFRNVDGKTNSRISQLIKAYMPNMVHH